MRCFVITKKHIIAAACFFSIIPVCILSAINMHRLKTVEAFRTADKIMSEVLPTTEEPAAIHEIKEKVYSATQKKPEKILQSLSGIFPEPTASATAPPAVVTPLPTQSQIPTEIPTTVKTAISDTEFKNETEYEITADIFKNEPLIFSENPQVLIIHTHTTECYTPEVPTGLPDNSRSTDSTKNMIAVGDIIRTELEKAGITVIHDKTVHDYPSYQGAYGRSLTTADNILKQNKSIEIILDIHRDAIVDTNGARIKLVKEIDDAPYAQMMIVCGTNAGGLTHPSWSDNLNFAVKIQQHIQSQYPGLMRPVNIRKERFNQHLAPGSLILEIGTHGNTISEAKNSATILGKMIGDVITQKNT